MTPQKRTFSVHNYFANSEPSVPTLHGRNINFSRNQFKSDEWTLDPPDGLTRDIYVTSEEFQNQRNNQDQTWNGFFNERFLTWFWILYSYAMLLATFYVLSNMMQAKK